jgi:hypothetical protein
MFLILLLLIIVAACAHIAIMKARTRQRIAKVFLIYLLVGYCGIPMVFVSLWCMMSPASAASSLGFPPGGPFQQFFSVAYLGMAILSLLAPFFRRSFLVGPAIVWAVFFAGATVIHMNDMSAHHSTSHGGILIVFATHGLISLLLVVSLVASGVWRER